jgi:DNA-binding HxlR family transcriptional regulator
MLVSVYMMPREKACSGALCPIKKTAGLLSDIWTILIIRELILSDQRFCELENSLSGISTRTLTLKLKKLIEEKLVEKTDTNYILTKKGRKLSEVFDAMNAYGKKYL